MKRLIFFCLILSFFAPYAPVLAQSNDEGTGLLGDNFSLEGALEAFKVATSMENFETLLNEEDRAINNLDLNDDGEIDYLRVEDHMEGDVHAIVIQALISEDESQDVAVIEIEKTGDESAVLQIVGDEYLYGKDVFVEPFEEVGTSDGKGGPSADYRVTRIVINVWAWPSVRFVYAPNYVVYRSPFRWRVYPRAWRPWRPLTWNVYRGKRVHYGLNYRYVNTHRVVGARKIYTPKRRSSTVVVKKSKTVKVRNNNGNTVVKKQTQTTKVKKNKNGNVTGKKTTKTKKVKKGKNGTKGKKVTKTKKVKRKSGN